MGVRRDVLLRFPCRPWPGEVLNVIRQLNGEYNLTMLMVTHQMGFVREISDRVCFLYEGKIAE